MNIGMAAKKTMLAAKTIRYYEKEGLFPPPERGGNGYRHYSETDIETLRFIHRARQLGFSIKDVRGLLALWQDTDRSSADVKSMTLEQIDKIDERIEELKSIRTTLKDLSEQCHGDDRPDCPIIKNLLQADPEPT